MHRILLVEDEPAIAETVLYALRTAGFPARHCLTGGEALRAAQREHFDLVVLDVGLPDIGGFALCRELRRERDLPVIFLTAHDSEAERILGLEIGADDYVAKPFSPRELVRACASCCDAGAHPPPASRQTCRVSSTMPMATVSVIAGGSWT